MIYLKKIKKNYTYLEKSIKKEREIWYILLIFAFLHKNFDNAHNKIASKIFSGVSIWIPK